MFAQQSDKAEGAQPKLLRRLGEFEKDLDLRSSTRKCRFDDLTACVRRPTRPSARAGSGSGHDGRWIGGAPDPWNALRCGWCRARLKFRTQDFAKVSETPFRGHALFRAQHQRNGANGSQGLCEGESTARGEVTFCIDRYLLSIIKARTRYRLMPGPRLR